MVHAPTRAESAQKEDKRDRSVERRFVDRSAVNRSVLVSGLSQLIVNRKISVTPTKVTSVLDQLLQAASRSIGADP